MMFNVIQISQLQIGDRLPELAIGSNGCTGHGEVGDGVVVEGTRISIFFKAREGRHELDNCIF